MSSSIEANFRVKSFSVLMDISEFPKENVNVSTDGGWLVITAKTVSNDVKFEYRLPPGIKANNISQKIVNGMLIIEGKL
ncbi:heat shock protein beta-3-like [Centruroides sculpturatus]|uniref:heat shock protein beta-3-like n=1 Tax=Centruroides sculpturatus TaxID=218467 RepID=UPI000C6C9017|nr:heat shock protein beta-3-like [Centruroides sculpturatus]